MKAYDKDSWNPQVDLRVNQEKWRPFLSASIFSRLGVYKPSTSAKWALGLTSALSATSSTLKVIRLFSGGSWQRGCEGLRQSVLCICFYAYRDSRLIEYYPRGGAVIHTVTTPLDIEPRC